MTIDKIKHYLKEPLFSHISRLNAEQLREQKKALLNDMATIKHTQDIIFNRTIELKYIKYLLNEN